MLSLAAGQRLVTEYTRGFGLAHAFTSIGLDGLSGGESSWLAFRHG
jgi:hypothetical protein